jgi:hypothetical protein
VSPRAKALRTAGKRGKEVAGLTLYVVLGLNTILFLTKLGLRAAQSVKRLGRSLQVVSITDLTHIHRQFVQITAQLSH